MNLSWELRCPIEFRIRVVAAISGWNTFKSVEILLLKLIDAEESVLSFEMCTGMEMLICRPVMNPNSLIRSNLV